LGFAGWQRMKKPRRLLIGIENEVIEAKSMLRSKRAELARSRSKLKRGNAQRVIRTIEKTLDNIRDHRHLLEEEAAGQKSVVATSKSRRTETASHRQQKVVPARGFRFAVQKSVAADCGARQIGVLRLADEVVAYCPCLSSHLPPRPKLAALVAYWHLTDIERQAPDVCFRGYSRHRHSRF
jgi:hypothetical protein